MRSWYGPDETREPWCFLALAPETNEGDASSTSWALGVGNAHQLVSTESQQVQSNYKEADLLVALGEVLDSLRYTGATLVTPEERTIPRLRRRLLACAALQSPTFRGFNHIVLEVILERYFDLTSLSELNKHSENQLFVETDDPTVTSHDRPNFVRQLWQVWTTIYRLVPVTACLGEPL
jgi:hypothetical protein